MDQPQIFHLPKKLNKDSFKDLPTTTGIYIFRKGYRYMYVGKSVHIKARILSHFENSVFDEKEKAIFSSSDRIECIITDSEFNALLLESKLIQLIHLNIMLYGRTIKAIFILRLLKMNNIKNNIGPS
jgi:excinuclease UvrABC nuclease subunit